jgi:hypothetical protein
MRASEPLEMSNPTRDKRALILRVTHYIRASPNGGGTQELQSEPQETSSPRETSEPQHLSNPVSGSEPIWMSNPKHQSARSLAPTPNPL